MHPFRAFLLIALAVCVLMPQAMFAAELPLLDPGWSIVPDPSELDPSCKPTDPLGMGGILVLVQNLMNAAVSLTVIVMVLVIAYAGFLFLTSPFNSENRSKAKSTLFGTFMGVIIVLAGWLVVDFVMKVLYNPDAVFAGKAIGPWSQIITGGDACIQARDTKSLFGNLPFGQGPSVDSSVGAGGAGGSGSSARTGRCTVQTGGACAPANLAAFGSAANQASQICYAESRGVIASVSGSDRMRNDPNRRAFSFGLFQINLTQHTVAGLNCPAAFEGKNYTAKVVNEDLYARCVAAAKNPNHNIAEAVATYNRSKWREWSTGKTCRLAVGERGVLAVSQCSSRAVPFII